MGKKQVLVIAGTHSHKLYSSISIRGERISVVSPEDSLDFLKHEGADVVVLDSGHDSMKGISLLKGIKASSQETPVILLTDVSSEDMAVKAFKAGVRDYFRKPVNFFDLKYAINHILTIKRTSKEKRLSYDGKKEVTDNQSFDTINTDIPSHILRIVNVIQENFSRELSLEMLAKEANLSKYQFCRTFRKFVGVTPMGFLRILRIHRSKELLKGKDLTISMVSSEVGFPDVSSFGRSFKQLTGITPGAYRNSLYRK